MQHVKTIVSLVLIGLVVILVVQNAAVIEFNLFFWTVSMSRAVMFFLLLAVGILIGWLWSAHTAHKKKRTGQRQASADAADWRKQPRETD